LRKPFILTPSIAVLICILLGFGMAALAAGNGDGLAHRVAVLEHAVKVMQANNTLRDEALVSAQAKLAKARDQLACYHSRSASGAWVANRHGRLVRVVRLRSPGHFRIVTSAC
jgi:hypothetical protein